MMEEPEEGTRAKSWQVMDGIDLSLSFTTHQAHLKPQLPPPNSIPTPQVYAAMPGVDSLYSGLSKRTPTGGFFSS